MMLGHKKRAGKDTVAEMMKKELECKGKKVAVVGFADVMKEVIADMFGIDLETLERLKNEEIEIVAVGWDENVKLGTMRTVLQRFGSGKMKELFGNTVWKDLLVRRWKGKDVDFLIVKDFRYPYEKIEGAFTVNVWRDLGWKDEHSSENALDGYAYDYVLLNDGSVEELEEKVKLLTDELVMWQELGAVK